MRKSIVKVSIEGTVVFQAKGSMGVVAAGILLVRVCDVLIFIILEHGLWRQVRRLELLGERCAFQ